MVALCSVVQLNVYDRDASTLRGTFQGTDGTGVIGLQWSDVLGEVGSASLSAPLLQSLLVDTPDLFEDAIVKVATNLTTDPDDLTEIFGFLAEGGEWSLIGDGEDAGKARGLQCRGLLALVGDWIVFPENGFKTYGGDHRAFGWMSKSSPFSFAESQWTGTVHGKKWKDVGSTADRYKRPKGWPDPNAQWIQCNSKENQYFVREFTLDEDCEIVIFASADENLRCWLDSELVIKNNSHGSGYTELNHCRKVLNAGDHTFGFHYVKELDPAMAWGLGFDYTDVDKGIVTCYKSKANGDIGDLIFHSNESEKWKGIGLDDDDDPPSWTAGGIVLQLAAEASDRGVDSVGRIAFEFTKSHDSDGNGWRDKHQRKWPIGTSGLQVFTDLGESDIDWDMLPDLTLKAYRDQGSDKSDTVHLTQGVNVLSYTAAETPVTATTLMIRSANKFLTRTDDDAEDAGDKREQFLQTGRSLSKHQAFKHADRALDGMSTTRASYTAEIIATDGCVPYQDFGKGDVILGYDRYLGRADLRVISISGSCPDDGPIRWTLELEDPSYATPDVDPTAPIAIGTGDGDEDTPLEVLFNDPLPAGYAVVGFIATGVTITGIAQATVGTDTLSALGVSRTSDAGTLRWYQSTAPSVGGEASVTITIPSGGGSGPVGYQFWLVGPKATVDGTHPVSGHGLGTAASEIDSGASFPYSNTAHTLSTTQHSGYVPEYLFAWAAGYVTDSGSSVSSTAADDPLIMSNGTDGPDMKVFASLTIHTTSGNTDAVTGTADGADATIFSGGLLQIDGRPT